MDIITLDMETYYDKAFSLSKMTTEAYIRDPRFEVIGVAVRVNYADTVWFSGSKKDTAEFLKQFDWVNSALLCQNTMFDAGILSFIFDIHPKVMLDTMCMARAWLGVDVSVSLKSLAQHYGVGEKGTEVLQALGKKRADFSAQELSSYGQYCVNDVELTYDIFNKMITEGFPKKELKVIDVTLRMFTRPLLHLDLELLAKHLENVKQVKADHVKQVGAMLITADGDAYTEEDLTDEAIKKLLQSNPKFAQVLESLHVEVPMKTSPSTGNPTYAFAKTDEAFKELLEHDDVRVQAVVSARLGVKTTLEETRTERFMDMALRGRVPIPLKYAGARTHRWSGCLVSDTQIIVYNIQNGMETKRIVDVLLDDLVWDGEEFVPHDGVAFSGYAEVIEWDGITGTENHVVYTEAGEKSLRDAMQGAHHITTTDSPTSDSLDMARRTILSKINAKC